MKCNTKVKLLLYIQRHVPLQPYGFQQALNILQDHNPETGRELHNIFFGKDCFERVENFKIYSVKTIVLVENTQ